VELATEKLDAGREAALRSLLDDSSAPVRQALLAYFNGLGASAAPFLRDIANGPNRSLARHAAWFLNELNFSDPVSEFRGFIRSLNYELETGSLLLARTVSPLLDISECCTSLDRIAGRCGELIVEPSTCREKCRIINRVMFHEWGFRGNVEHYTDPLNSLIDRVLARRKGIPISLGIVYLLVAGRLGIELSPVNLPGHFVVGCYGESEPFFVDPFENGLFRDGEEIFDLLRFHRIMPQASDLSPTPVREVLSRSCRNLANHYTAAGDLGRARLFASFVEEFDAAFARNT
jgi:regulator of sirC expression with transglutaminase-like and TPR domain